MATINGTLGDDILNGTSDDDSISGLAGNDTINGNVGNDTLVGGSGNDVLDGGYGYDSMYGGLGDDTYYVSSYGGSDAITEMPGEGTDTVLAFFIGDYTIGDNVENLSLLAGNLVATGNELDNVLTSNNVLGVVLRGMGGNDRLIGFAYDERLEGGTGNDWLDGSWGNDLLMGGDGYDSMYGGVGDDRIFVDNYGEEVIEYAGEGTDSVFASANFKLSDNVEKLTIQGSADLWAYGNAIGNTLTGNTGANKLYGLGGNDTLNGGEGSDWLEGGAGQNRLFGGTGNDAFVFRDGDFAGTTASTCDQIKDFASGDKIRLNFIDANTALAGDQAFAFVGTAAFSNTAGELRYEQISGNTYVEADTNGDGIADFMIRLDGLHTIVSGDLVL